MDFILASESARRVELLRRAGFDFEARKSGFHEASLKDPRETVETNASGKALAVAATAPDALVLAADTVVYAPSSKQVLGQAKNGEEVREMLDLLSGGVHRVYSGVAVGRGEKVSVRHAVTEVRMKEISGVEAEAYVNLGEVVGKAGGYAIQGRAAVFVEWVCGDYTNVVGLPLTLTLRMLERNGVSWY